MSITVRPDMIEAQLEAIEMARRETYLHGYLRIVVRSWAQHSKRSRERRVTEGTWRSRRRKCHLVGALASWKKRVLQNQMEVAERRARDAIIEARRLSRALRSFRASCLWSRQTRPLQPEYQRLRKKIRRRPMKRAWSRWQYAVQIGRLKGTFGSWRLITYHNGRLRKAVQPLFTRHKARVLLEIWVGWRRRAGASKVTRLLHAWTIIGPARRTLRVMGQLAKYVRVEEGRRLRMLRRGIVDGFVRNLVTRRQLGSASEQANEFHRTCSLRKGVTTLHQHLEANVRQTWAAQSMSHVHRKLALRACLDRWFSWHHHATLFVIADRHLCRTKRREGLREWRQYSTVTRAAINFRESRVWQSLIQCIWQWANFSVQSRRTNAFLRSTLVKRGLHQWHARVCAFKLQRDYHTTAWTSFRQKSLQRGLACLSGMAWMMTRNLCAIKRRKRRRKAMAMHLWLKRRRGLCLGLLYLRRWTNKRRTARLAMWRAGIWAGTSNAIYILKRWRRNVTRDREIRLCVRIAERRRDAVQSKMKHRHGFSLKRHVFTILRTHALDRNLARRIFKAWSSHSQSSRHVQRQAQYIRLRVGLRALCSWAKLSRRRCAFRHRATSYSIYRMKRETLTAWESAVYPVGRRYPFRNSNHENGDKCAETREQQVAIGSGTERTLGFCEVAVTVEEGISFQRPTNSLLLLRLPMVRNLVRRVLHSWKRLTAKGKRARYVQRMLPQKGRLLEEASTWSDQAIPRSRSIVCEEPLFDGVVIKLPETRQREVANVPSYGSGIPVPSDKQTTFFLQRGNKDVGVRMADGSHDFRRRYTGMGRGKYPASYLVDHDLRGGRALDGGSYLRIHLLGLSSKRTQSS